MPPASVPASALPASVLAPPSSGAPASALPASSFGAPASLLGEREVGEKALEVRATDAEARSAGVNEALAEANARVASLTDALEAAARKKYKGEELRARFNPETGDFDLIFGAARMNLKVVEIPVTYASRSYGSTQISRFRHGLLLLRMVLFAFRKLKAF